MLGTFIDKLSSLFDPSFILSHWAPAFVGVALSALLATILVGPGETAAWWDGRTSTVQAGLGLGGLLLITVSGYLLQSFSVPIVRNYEGYWPRLLRWLAVWSKAGQLSDFESLRKAEAYDILHFRFPQDKKRVMPTGLGNVLTAAEDYPEQVYGMNAPIWWPRLSALLPDALRGQIDAAVTPMLALINLSMIIGLLAAFGGVSVWLTDDRWWLLGAVLLGGLAAAWICYRAAVSQAVIYGDLVRVAFDLYRIEILKQMHIFVPDNYKAERQLWTALNTWIFTPFTMPWNTCLAQDLKMLQDPFYYDSHTVAGPSPTQRISAEVRHSFVWRRPKSGVE